MYARDRVSTAATAAAPYCEKAFEQVAGNENRVDNDPARRGLGFNAVRCSVLRGSM